MSLDENEILTDISSFVLPTFAEFDNVAVSCSSLTTGIFASSELTSQYSG